MGALLEPGVWCRERWCREDPDAAHRAGDGCTCDPHGRTAEPVPALARRTRLTAKASRLAAFACRACGAQARDMVESPELFFRCEPCAGEDRWPGPSLDCRRGRA